MSEHIWVKRNVKKVKHREIFYLRRNSSKEYIKGPFAPSSDSLYFCWDVKAGRPIVFHYAKCCWIKR